MMPGRKPLPVAVKKIRGTLQKCRTNPREPKPTGTLSTPPEYMSDAAKQAWQYAVENSPPGLLSALDDIDQALLDWRPHRRGKIYLLVLAV